jgi:acyl-CoA thioester hydrolase
MGAPLEHILRVRYGECDLQGIVFNAHYLNYFDTSITELWRSACGSYQAMLDRGVDIVLAEATLRFRQPARFDEELTLAVAVTHIGNTSVITRHTASRARGAGVDEGAGGARGGVDEGVGGGTELLAEGELRHVLVDRVTVAKTPLPDWLRAGLEPFRVGERAR